MIFVSNWGFFQGAESNYEGSRLICGWGQYYFGKVKATTAKKTQHKPLFGEVSAYS